jgi:uncharacterized Fe-S center protein
MSSKVFMVGSRVVRSEGNVSPLLKIGDLLKEAGLGNVVASDDPVAIKMHLGSSGGHRTIRPEFVRKVVDSVKQLGGRPFIAETCRPDAIQYLEIGNERGYNHSTLGCPVIIADGYKGEDFIEVETGGKIVDKVNVASAFYHAPSMIVLTHITGHGNACYAGAVKNIAMGCNARSTKGKIHRSVNVDPPVWYSDKCIACGECAEACNYGALTLVDDKPVIDVELCERCMRCARACSQEALVRPSPMRENFLEALVDGTRGVLSTFDEGRVLFVNFLLDVGPECDCAPFSDRPIIPDQGILASTDLVALEQACLDLLTKAPAAPLSRADEIGIGEGDKKFACIHGLDPQGQVEAGEAAGLGSKDYELVTL